MFALREVQEVTSRSITVTLPDDFLAKTVEIIILPVDESEELPVVEAELDAERLKLKELLLTAPTLSDEELEEFTKVRTWMAEWHAQEF